MNRDIFEGQWKRMRGEVKDRWGRLTDDELDRVKGQSDQLIGLLQEKYGYAKAEAREEFNEFLDELDRNL